MRESWLRSSERRQYVTLGATQMLHMRSQAATF